MNLKIMPGILGHCQNGNYAINLCNSVASNMSQSCRNRGISGVYRAGEVGAESASTECEVYINHSNASGIVYQLTNHLSPAIIKHSRNQTIVNRI